MQRIETKDILGKPIVIEWIKTDILSPVLSAFKKAVCELACQEISKSEVAFLKKCPQAVSEELFLRACAPFFEKGMDAVEWERVQETIHSSIKQFYLADVASFGRDKIQHLLNDVYFLATIKESEKILGFTMLASTPSIPLGSIKMINLIIASEAKGRGFEQLLLDSTLQVLPEIRHLFAFARPTNEEALDTYSKLGFTQNLNPVLDPNHPVNLEYLNYLEFQTVG